MFKAKTYFVFYFSGISKNISKNKTKKQNKKLMPKYGTPTGNMLVSFSPNGTL